MAGIKRFITYIYAYENGTKGINAGFAKVEIRGNECRIEVHLRGTPIRMGMDQVYLRLFGRDSIRHNLQTIGCLQAVRRGDCHILCGNNSSICMHNTILGLCKGTDRQHKKQTCENKFIYSPHSLIQPGYWKSQLRQPSLIRTYVLFCFLMIQSCNSSSRFRDSTIDFKA